MSDEGGCLFGIIAGDIPSVTIAEADRAIAGRNVSVRETLSGHIGCPMVVPSPDTFG